MRSFSMLRRFCLAMLWFACLLPLHASAANSVRLVTTEYPPHMSEHLPDGGIAVAIAREAFRRSGYAVEVRYFPWSRAVQLMRDRSADGLIGAWRNEEREKWLKFSRSIGSNKLGLFAHGDAPLKYRHLAELQGFRIGIVRGYLNPAAFNTAHLTTIESSSDEVNLRALAANRLDAVLIDKMVAQFIIRNKMPEEGEKLAWQEPAIEELPMYVAIATNNADADKLIAAFNAGLKTMEHDGTLAKMLKPAEF